METSIKLISYRPAFQRSLVQSPLNSFYVPTELMALQVHRSAMLLLLVGDAVVVIARVWSMIVWSLLVADLTLSMPLPCKLF
jgi:hypothetical protein